MPRKKNLPSKYMIWSIKLGILFLTGFVLYKYLFVKHSESEIKEVLQRLFEVQAVKYWATAAVLVIFNWRIEILKWRYLTRSVQNLSFTDASKGVLAGVAVGMVSTNRMGSFLGKILFLKYTNRIRGIFASIFGSLAQLITTLFFGLIGLIYFLLNWHIETLELYKNIFISLSVFLAIISVFIYLKPQWFSQKILSLSWLGSWKKQLLQFEKYHTREKLRVLSLSVQRYLIFSFQFYLMLKAFGVSIFILDALHLIALVYLISTVIPTFMLGALGLRESVALLIFSPLINDSAAIVFASVTLWILNLLLPALMGVYYIVSSKIKLKE